VTTGTRAHQAWLAALLICMAAGCARRTDAEVEAVPIGTPVEVTRQDGGVVRGTLTARDDGAVRMGPEARPIPRDEIVNLEVVDGAAPPPLPPAAKFREFTVPEGTRLALRLTSPLGSSTSRVNDAVEASLDEPVMVEGLAALPAGSLVRGVVTEAVPSAKVQGRARLSVRFQSVSIGDEAYALSAGLQQTAESGVASDARTIGIPAAGGAVIGAIIGGKKGAGIGAAVGGGAGTAVVLSTTGEEIHLPSGTILSVAIDGAIDVRVPITR
jgi:outer membrane lipoprotein SlyB